MRAFYQRCISFRRPSVDAVIGLFVLPVGCVGLLTEAYFRTSLSDAQRPMDCTDANVNFLTSEKIQELHSQGIVVIDNVLSKERLRDIRNDLKTSAALQTNFTLSGNDEDVRQDKVQWVRCCQESSSESRPLDYGISLVRGIAHRLECFDGFFASNMKVPRDCQLAVYPGDKRAAYKCHMDRCTNNIFELGLLEYLRLSDFRTRVVTVILYLNDSERPEHEGGSLRYWNVDGEAIDICPKGGKLVVFDASRIPHQVLPSTTERTALTCWITGDLLADNERHW